jgi:hypothetical protein
MKKFFKIIGVLLLLAIAFVLIAGLIVKKDYHLDRSITINAPKDSVWLYVQSLQQMEKWSPWLEADPNVKTSHEGQPGAVGSVYRWDGNKEVGKGNQTITKTNGPGSMDTHIEFIKPFSGQADAYIRLSDTTGGTKVTWGFDTRYKYPMNVMQLFVDMDGMMSKQYDKGLGKLKALAEKK